MRCLICYWYSLFLLFPVIPLVYTGGCTACLMYYFSCHFFFCDLDASWCCKPSLFELSHCSNIYLKSFPSGYAIRVLQNITYYGRFTISAFGFNLQYFLLIIAFSVHNCRKSLFSYRRKKKKEREIVST